MKRRGFLAGAAGASLLSTSPAQAQGAKRAIIELRYYHLRNTMDNQRKRLAEYLEKAAIPALRKAGVASVGLFGANLGHHSPALLLMTSFNGFSGMEDVRARITSDKEYGKLVGEFYNSPVLPYQRMSVDLFQGFSGFPQIEVPQGAPDRPGRLFELRCYESNTPLSLRRKVKMFEDGEIALFRKNGLLPVFFGESVAGANMPNLTYMIAFDNLAAREANWRAFATSPEWKKMSSTPGLADGEVVSNITSTLWSPMPGSMIR
jgi:hypothetical protein